MTRVSGLYFYMKHDLGPDRLRAYACADTLGTSGAEGTDMSDTPLGLQGLAAMAHALMRPQPLHELLETAADHACAALRAATVSIGCLEADDSQVRTIINAGDLGPEEDRWPRDEIYPLESFGRLSFSIHQMHSWVDSIDNPDCDPHERQLLEKLKKGSSLSTAIVVDGVSWGEFYATRHIGHRAFDSDAVAYAEVMVAILAAAISRWLRESALRDLAFRDPLTGLLNRRALDDEALRVFDVPPDASRTVAVVAIDINNLKMFNDTRGHARGDQQIKDVASAMSRAFDPLRTSVVARVGGDEFTVLVTGHDADTVLAAANAVCLTISDIDGSVGVSAGVAVAEISGPAALQARELFAAADRAQYVAKRSHSLVAVMSDEILS